MVRRPGRPGSGKGRDSQTPVGAWQHIQRKWFGGIGEYVIDWGPGYRIYLARDGEALVILFGGGTKRGQQKDIDQAKALHAEYKERKKALAVEKKGRR